MNSIPELFNQFRRPNRSYCRLKVGVYLDKVEIFRRKLAVLIQLTWGQPARAPELLVPLSCSVSSGKTVKMATSVEFSLRTGWLPS